MQLKHPFFVPVGVLAALFLNKLHTNGQILRPIPPALVGETPASWLRPEPALVIVAF